MRVVRIWKDLLNKGKGDKLRLLVISICVLSLALFSYIRNSRIPVKEPDPSSFPATDEPSPEKSPAQESLRSPKTAIEAGRSLIRTNLLKDGRSPLDPAVEKPSRNIFMPVIPVPKEEPPPKIVPVEEVKPVINLKLVGFIEDQAEPPQTGLIRHAILSMGGEVIIAQKDDIVNGQYEITAIEADSVEIRIKDSGYTEKLTIE